jgi:hypothetical protein
LVAIFASGLTLAAHRFAAKPAVFAATFVKIIVQPAIFAGLLIELDCLARDRLPGRHAR